MSDRESNIKNLRGIIDSCFAYGNADRGGYYFDKYIKPYQKKLGEEFDEVFEERLKELKTNYTVKRGVYTDGEDCTYNALVKK